MDYNEKMATLRQQLQEQYQTRMAQRQAARAERGAGRRPRGEARGAAGRDRIDWEARNQEMRRLRDEEGWTYTQIGDHFGGLSRQRVQQILGPTGGRQAARQKRELVLAAPYEETNEEIAARLGLHIGTVSTYRRNKPRRMGGRSSGRSQRIQRVTDALIALLRERGLDVQPQPPRSPVDLLVGRHRLSICTCSGGRIPPSQRGRLINPRYSFAVRKSRAGDDPLDFYVLVIGESQAIFIIPYAAVPAGAEHLHFCWPSQRPQLGRYQQFCDRFDLLEERPDGD